MKVLAMFVSRKHPPVPDHFETERLLIRAPQPGDGSAVNDAIRESIDELRPWMPWARVVPSVAESETYARESALRFRNHEDLPLLLFRKSDGLVRRRERAAQHRLGRAALRDRLLGANKPERAGLHHRGGQRDRGDGVRQAGSRAAGNPLRRAQRTERRRRAAGGLHARGDACAATRARRMVACAIR